MLTQNILRRSSHDVQSSKVSEGSVSFSDASTRYIRSSSFSAALALLRSASRLALTLSRRRLRSSSLELGLEWPPAPDEGELDGPDDLSIARLRRPASCRARLPSLAACSSAFRLACSSAFSALLCIRSARSSRSSALAPPCCSPALVLTPDARRPCPRCSSAPS